MKKLNIVFKFLLLFLISIVCQSNFYDGPTIPRIINLSVCTLVNPLSSSTKWVFSGSQVVCVKLKNGNILGVDAMLECDIYANDSKEYFAILPGCVSREVKYDMFGYVPIEWRFILSTISSAALIYGNANWALK